MLVNQIIELKKAIVEICDGDIVHVTYKEGLKLDSDLQRELKLIYTKCGYESLKKFIVSAQDFVSVENTFWDCCKKSERFAKGRLVAIVAPSLATRMLARNYLKIYKPQNQYKIFETVDDAATWLNEVESE